MKVGIIGGGAAGLITAWLIQQEHEVVLFEKQNFLGGHALTVPVTIDGTTRHINAGFEFFNDALFPLLQRLLNILDVDVAEYELSTAFCESDGSSSLYPPLKEHKLRWDMLTYRNMTRYMQLAYLRMEIKKLVKQADRHITVEEFIESLYLTRKFKDKFFYPYIAAGWGAPLEQFKKFVASDIFSWFKGTLEWTKPPIWKEIVGGVSRYIEALVQELTHTKIALETGIQSITSTNGKYTLTTEGGSQTEFDALVIATNAEDALRLLDTSQQSSKLRSILQTIDYFPAKIAVHNDKTFMPQQKENWSILNIRQENERYSFLTIYKPWQGEVFRSWLCPEQGREPSFVYSTLSFRHVVPNDAYFAAQKEIAKLQGVDGLWLAGIYTGGLDSHESAVKSAIEIAKKLASKSDQLQALLGNKSASKCPFLNPK